jgi:hypothetical protein
MPFHDTFPIRYHPPLFQFIVSSDYSREWVLRLLHHTIADESHAGQAEPMYVMRAQKTELKNDSNAEPMSEQSTTKTIDASKHSTKAKTISDSFHHKKSPTRLQDRPQFISLQDNLPRIPFPTVPIEFDPREERARSTCRRRASTGHYRVLTCMSLHAAVDINITHEQQPKPSTPHPKLQT